MNDGPLNRPVRMAVYFDQSLEIGGGYQQAVNAARIAKALPVDICNVFFYAPTKRHAIALKKHGIDARSLNIGLLRYALLKIRGAISHPNSVRLIQLLFGLNRMEKAFARAKIDLVYFVSQGGAEAATFLEKTSYIVTIWDLCHRDEPEFPEVRADRVFEARENAYNRALRKAVAVVSDSELGKERIVKRYGVDEDRVRVIPFSPGYAVRTIGPHTVDMKSRFCLDCEFVFYPAQFWPHKNHVYILEGLYWLERLYGKKIGAIFAGNDVAGNLDHLRRVCGILGLQNRIRFSGFVEDELMPQLYMQSLALVMPTYFGPTNLPPLEAFSLGVPVIYSNLEGLREQVRDAALLVDLKDPKTLAEALFKLSADGTLISDLKANGARKAAEQKDSFKLAVLADIVERFRIKRKCWA